MRIRRAVPADCASLSAVHARAIRHGCARHYAAADVAAWSGRMSPAAYAEPIATRTMFVAEDDDGRIAGYAQLCEEEGVVEGVYVEPDCMRRGVGRALVAACEDAARKAQVERLTLDASFNAVPFYAALGYGAQGELRHALGGGHSIGCVLMAKRLAFSPEATPLA